MNFSRRFKRVGSALLAAAILAPSAGIVAYAEEDAEMKQALTYVKERIDVPEHLSRFSYRKRTLAGKTSYSFSWEMPEGSEKWEVLTVSICGKVITSYSHLGENSWRWGENYSFGKLSKEELLEKTKEHVKKLNPTVYENIETNGEVHVYLAADEATVSLSRVKDGIPVSGQNGYIRLNKNTGELIEFSINWIPGAGFRSSKDAISTEKAIEGYKTEFPISLVYTAEYDWKEKKYTPHLIYRRDKFGQIDAFTGKLATFEESYDYYDSGDDDAAAEDAGVTNDANPATGGGVSFTEEEKEKMEQEANLIKPEAALQALKDAGIYNLPKNAELTYSNSSYNTRLGAFTLRFNFSADDPNYYSIDGGEPMPAAENIAKTEKNPFHGNCSINAETGEVLSYYGYANYADNAELKSEKSAKKLLANALTTIAGDKATEFKTDDISYNYSDTNGTITEDGVVKNVVKGKLTSAGLSSPRYAYDIPCDPERVSISIDASGKVENYSMTYYGLEYPEPKDIISAEKAYEDYFGQVDYSLLYRCAMHEKKVETALVYNSSNELYIDAFTGKLTNYSGAEIIEEDGSGYTDLEGSEYREIAEKLAIYGITLKDEQGALNADAYITRQDYSNLISSIMNDSPIIENGEKPLTRQYAAKILTQGEISPDIAELPGLFKSPFPDVSETSKYVGYIAVANAKGLLTGNKDGKFLPNKKITRGEALQFAYDYLSK